MSRSLLTQGSRHLPPWLIFDVRQKKTMNMAINGYHTQRCNDTRRDGMYLELIDTSSGDEVAEVFYSDQTKKMQVSVFAPELPLEAIEFLIGKAKAELPERKTE